MRYNQKHSNLGKNKNTAQKDGIGIVKEKCILF